MPLPLVPPPVLPEPPVELPVPAPPVAGPDEAAGWDGVTVPELALESPDEDEPLDAEVPPVEPDDELDDEDDGELVDELVVSVVGVVVVDVEGVLDVSVETGALATAVAVGTVNGGYTGGVGRGRPAAAGRDSGREREARDQGGHGVRCARTAGSFHVARRPISRGGPCACRNAGSR